MTAPASRSRLPAEIGFGVYVHFPYCRHRCPYCDFAVHARAKIPHERYRDAVLAELARRAPLFSGRRLTSIYFGGGTPGLWRPSCISDVIRAVRAAFAPADAMEITVEHNPEDLVEDDVRALVTGGVNRLSLGVQSFSPRHLHALGRHHGPDDARRAVDVARRAGVERLSVDLMFALAGQGMAEVRDDVACALALGTTHLSAYTLTIEPRTAFAAMQQKGVLSIPDGSVAAEMFDLVEERLTGAGFVHYEVSSYAQPGHEARHNTLYWSGAEYLGLGCSAHSFRRLPDGRGERFGALRSVDHYLAALSNPSGDTLAADPLLALYEPRTPAELDGEAIWLGLRRTAGIARARHAALYGSDPVVAHAREIARLVDEGLLVVDAETLKLTARGLRFADEVGSRFL